MSDWEDMVDSDVEIELKKDEEKKLDEEEEIKERETKKPMPKVEKERAPKIKEEVKQELTEEERKAEELRIEKEIQRQQEQDVKDFFGDSAQDLNQNINLENETDYLQYAKLTHNNLKKSGIKAYMKSYLKELLQLVGEDFKVDDLQDIQSKLKVIINTKQIEEKQKYQKKKEK